MSPMFSPESALAPLRIDTSWPSTTRVGVVGEVDRATAPVLRDRLLTVLRDHSPAGLVVDLAGVTFLDCAGIGAFIGVRNAAVQAGCQLRITDPQPIVHRVLEVTGLLRILTAPIEQPQRLPARSEHPLGTEPVPVAVAVPPSVTVAA
jgi:anti-anti-sigma factor